MVEALSLMPALDMVGQTYDPNTQEVLTGRSQVPGVTCMCVHVFFLMKSHFINENVLSKNYTLTKPPVLGIRNLPMSYWSEEAKQLRK